MDTAYIDKWINTNCKAITHIPKFSKRQSSNIVVTEHGFTIYWKPVRKLETNSDKINMVENL